MANLLRKGDRIESAVPPTTTRSAPIVTTVNKSKKSDHSAFYTWDLAQVWIESVTKEETTRKQWEQMYGWMADFDAKGNLKPKRRTLEHSSRFSNTVPNSRGHDYGWHLQTQLGEQIQNLQKSFDNQHKKHLSTVILGYE